MLNGPIDLQVWFGLITLTVLEIVLNIDNIVILSILSAKLSPHQRPMARRIGLAMATGIRLLLLLSLVWLMRLTRPLFQLFGHAFSIRDLILIGGGLFLTTKSTQEIHEHLEGEDEQRTAVAPPSLIGVIVQIVLLDLIFSLDSVITAIGMAQELWMMITAILIAAVVMVVSARVASHFIERHPTVKMLALSFLLLIGFTLIAESFGQHVPKGYIYFSMAFSIFVESLNLRSVHHGAPVKLRESYRESLEEPPP